MAAQPMPVHSISAILDWEKAGNARIPGYKTEIGDKLRSILGALGFKDEAKVEETLMTGAMYGWPKLTESVTFETPGQRDAAVAKLRPIFLALNPAHFTFAVEDKGPSHESKSPRHSFNLAVQDYAVAYKHEMYEMMLDTLTAIETGLKGPQPGPV